MQALNDLLDLLATLRDPERGDPWHQGQNFSSIAPYTIEEAYEVADAIERQNMQDLCTELGDLLFQVIYHAQLASEKGCFSFTDVVTALDRKLRDRSAPQFQGRPGGRQQEKMHKLVAGSGGHSSLLDDIPTGQPALSRAQKLQLNAATAGFDWTRTSEVLEKIAEEFTELGAEMKSPGARNRITHELGDILFALVNLARHLRVDAEGALRSANHRFEQRFRYIEDRLRERNLTPAQVPLEELERLWQEAKRL